MSALPPAVRERLAVVLAAEPDSLHVHGVSGGCVSPAARVQAGDRAVFVKWLEPGAPSELLRAEATGLAVLAATGAVRVPAVVALTGDALVLEWLESGSADASGWRALGASLARLHRADAPAFGFAGDNFIGALPQANGWIGDWPRFFRERRIVPQLERALEADVFEAHERRELAMFADSLDDILQNAATGGASLLHGDLWSGNALALQDGTLALIDPSCWYGDREVDLAMAELFGGFPPAFFEAYEATWPTPAPARSRRRAAYRVYYLLVHVNLFGAGYVRGTLEAVRAAQA